MLRPVSNSLQSLLEAFIAPFQLLVCLQLRRCFLYRLCHHNRGGMQVITMSATQILVSPYGSSPARDAPPAKLYYMRTHTHTHTHR